MYFAGGRTIRLPPTAHFKEQVRNSWHFRVEREVESASFESAGLNPAITIGLADCEHAIAHSFTKNLMVRLFYCSPVSGFLKNDFKIAAADGGRSVLMDDLPARFFF